MSGIDQSPQLLIGIGFDIGKKRIDPEEVLNAIAVIGTLIEFRILQHWAKPYRARAQTLDVGKLLLNAGKFAPLVPEAIGIVEGVKRLGSWIIEAVHHKKVDPLIAPIRR